MKEEKKNQLENKLHSNNIWLTGLATSYNYMQVFCCSDI